MTKHEANAALCRALGVEPLPLVCDCYDMEQACTCEPIYPDLTSADALMDALEARDESAELAPKHCRVRTQWATLLPGEKPGSMLFRAACAAFGIEVNHAE